MNNAQNLEIIYQYKRVKAVSSIDTQVSFAEKTPAFPITHTSQTQLPSGITKSKVYSLSS